MCTVIFLDDLGLLSKNRDKERPTEEEVVCTSEFLAVRTKNDDYFSLGVNHHGVAFVSTAVNSPQWTRAVEEGRGQEVKALMREERNGRQSPTALLSEELANLRSAAVGVDLLEGAGMSWMGYNVVVADRTGCVVVEMFGRQVHSRRLADRDAITNHFTAIDHGAKRYADYPSSFDRLAYANEFLGEIGSFEGLSDAIHPRANPERAARIWRTGAFRTVSSAIIALDGPKLYHADDLGKDFTCHSFL